jgi:hypothetical protein
MGLLMTFNLVKADFVAELVGAGLEEQCVRTCPCRRCPPRSRISCGAPVRLVRAAREPYARSEQVRHEGGGSAT